MLRQLVSLATCRLLRVADTVACGFNGHFASRNCKPLMSALGQKRTSDCGPLMSAIHPTADMDGYSPNIRFVPKADIQ